MMASAFPSRPSDFTKRFKSLDELRAYTKGRIPERLKPHQIKGNLRKTPDALKKEEYIREVIEYFHGIADELAAKIKAIIGELPAPPKPPKLPPGLHLPWEAGEETAEYTVKRNGR